MKKDAELDRLVDEVRRATHTSGDRRYRPSATAATRWCSICRGVIPGGRAAFVEPSVYGDSVACAECVKPLG